MELEKYEPQATVSKLADRPKDSAAELKAKFDEAEKNIGEYINEKLIPELEEMEEYSNIAFRYTGTIASGDEMPVLTTSDAGKVYNILDDRTYEYTCIWEGAVTKTDNYTYIYVSGIYDNIHNVYRVGYDQFVTSKTDKTKTIKVFYDGRDESGDARFLYDYNYEPKILFENKEEVIVTIDTNIKLLRGENIVWTGHFWNKLSCYTDNKVEKDSCYPVQSGAVYNAIKEHADNTEDFHGLPLTKGSGENSLQQKNTQANGKASFSEGMGTIASGDCSHSAGYKTRAQGMYSFAQGLRSEARGHRSCAQGYHTVAQGENQHARGKFNIIDNENKYADIVGNGTSDEERSNAYTLDWEGNAEFAGDVKSKGNTLESTANKITAIDENSTDEQYPSAKAVWDKFNEKIIDKNVSSSDDFDEFTADYFNLTSGGSVILKGYIEDEYNSYILFVQAGHEDVLSTHQTLLITNCYGRRTSLMTRIHTSNKWSEWESYLTTDSVRNDLTSTSTTSPLSANQGKVLNEKIGDIDEALEHIIEIQEQLMEVSE